MNVVNDQTSKRVIVASHRRSGTHLAIDSIINNFGAFRDNPPISSVTLDHLAPHTKKWSLTPEELERRIADRPCVLKTHTHGNLLDFFEETACEYVRRLIDGSHVIYVYRDGRDVMVSQYHYHKKFDKKSRNQEFAEYIRAANDFDQATYEGEKNRVEYWAFHVRSWVKKPDCLLLSFEDIRNNLESAMNRVSHFICEPVNPEVRDVAIRTGAPLYKVGKLIQRVFRTGVERSAVEFRKGIIGDWRAHFSEADLEFFEENSGGLNRDLGFG